MDYLGKNLVTFCSDGASIMLGRSSGVGVRMRNDFPNIIIWHCLNHWLQLVLDDSVKEIKSSKSLQNLHGLNICNLSPV